MNKRFAFVASALLAFAASTFAQSVIPNNPGKKPTFAIRNATIVPVTSAPIPFQRICTPMHTRMKDDRRMTTSIAASPSNAAIRSAKR